MIRENNYIAEQTENGFQVFFQNDNKSPVKVSFEDFNTFADKYNKYLTEGKEPELSDKEKLMLSLWQMILIPDTTIH